jgi:hypothetical protein
VVRQSLLGSAPSSIRKYQIGPKKAGQGQILYVIVFASAKFNENYFLIGAGKKK